MSNIKFILKEVITINSGIDEARRNIREWIKFNTVNGLIGFQCWDCYKEIKGLDLKDENYKSNPISLNGYIMTICEECSQIED